MESVKYACGKIKNYFFNSGRDILFARHSVFVRDGKRFCTFFYVSFLLHFSDLAWG